MSPALILAVSAGVAIALQVVANSVGLRDLGLGALIGISGATTALAGLALALFAARPEATGRAVLCAVASGLLGAFILGSIVLAANRGGSRRRSRWSSPPSSSSGSWSTGWAYSVLPRKGSGFSRYSG